MTGKLVSVSLLSNMSGPSRNRFLWLSNEFNREIQGLIGKRLHGSSE